MAAFEAVERDRKVSRTCQGFACMTSHEASATCDKDPFHGVNEFRKHIRFFKRDCPNAESSNEPLRGSAATPRLAHDLNATSRPSKHSFASQ
jgi:hypothetical protein